MNQELQKIKDLLKGKGIENFDESEISRFINNWMPDSNYDYQQDYFLINLRKALIELS